MSWFRKKEPEKKGCPYFEDESELEQFAREFAEKVIECAEMQPMPREVNYKATASRPAEAHVVDDIHDINHECLPVIMWDCTRSDYIAKQVMRTCEEICAKADAVTDDKQRLKEMTEAWCYGPAKGDERDAQDA